MKKFVFTLLSALVILSMIVACAPEPIVQTVEVEKVVEKTVEVEKVVEKTVEVEKVVLSGAIPYPEGPLVAGMREPKTFEVSEMIEFRSFDSYCEPDYVKEMVNQGLLPPVEERLPEEPFVYKSAFMSDGPGEYGGVWRGVWAAPPAGEFTTEDIMFMWEDNILDPSVNSPTSASFWEIEGKPIQLEALDEYTLKWTFPVPFPTTQLYNMTNLIFSPGPAHILKPHHPKYGGKDYQSYRDALPPNSLPVVTMGPWVPVEYRTDEFMVMRRNPYYWKVDENGCQLPYIDEVQFTYAQTGATRTLNTINGTADHANVENPETFDETVRRASDANAPFRVEWGPETLGFWLELNQSKYLGVSNDRDAAVRELLRDVRFRRALTQAIDREGIARSLTNGPHFRPWPGGLFPGSQYYDRASVAYFPYAPDTSRALLAEIGLQDTDGDGILNWTEGPMSGQNVELAMTTWDDISAGAIMGPALVLLFEDIGIKVNFRLLDNIAMADADTNGTWEMRIGRPGQAFATPNIRCKDIAPVTNEFGWHRVGDKPEEYQPFEEELKKISDAFCLETDFDKGKELMFQYNKLHTENVYTIGLVIGRYGLMLNKYFKNIPIGTPAFLYQWDFNNFLPEQVWLAEADRWALGQTEIHPETVGGVGEFAYNQ